MIYLKSILVGIIAAVAASALWILATLVAPIVIMLVSSRGTGSGGIGAVSFDSASILAAALVGFAAGCYWQVRRLSKRRAEPR